MPTVLLTHPTCVEHDAGDFHPERPDRLRAILAEFEREDFALLERQMAPRATLDQLRLVHAASYVESVFEAVPKTGHVHLDPDTAICPASGEAALRAAGAVCAAVDLVMTGRVRNAFCAIRPPGHHAEPERAMGFCLFNNVAIGAMHARKVHGVRRVAVVDFDVHHGNGTQAVFESDAELFYASSHQFPAYPGTGSARERGRFNNVVNVELAPGSGTTEFRAGYTDAILPALRDFRPELVIVSAGFDAHARDPLAYIRLATGDFGWVTREIVKVAEECCQGRVVSALEGGYDLEALAASCAAHVRTLMGN
jgi:acetoin utilization deacetylase AcuC-like enzyme